ncbi:hypothetical protein K439DRAFT_1625752 [Ramaria rubella]|nr:hypothetical protein K439DRAFT_1625752 [Ramaria rubella]
MNTDSPPARQESAESTPTPSPLIRFLVFGSVFLPLVCIPYIPIRRHLLGLKRTIHTLSNDTALLHRELSTTLLTAQLRKEESTRLTDQLRQLSTQLSEVTKRVTDLENARLSSQREIAGQFLTAAAQASDAENARLKTEETLRRQIDCLRRQIDGQRISPDVLQDVSTSLVDTAAFHEEVEIQLGWPHSMPRDRGIDRMRQLALKLHTIAQTKVRLSPLRAFHSPPLSSRLIPKTLDKYPSTVAQ